MASVFGTLLQHLAFVCLLFLGLPNTTYAFVSPICPENCSCLGNIVDCSATQITFLPSNISDFPWIEELQLNENPGLNLTDSDLPHLPNLAVLELQRLGLLELSDLGDLPRLSKLSLRDNELSSVGSLFGLRGLRQLDLSRNSLTALPAHLDLPHLRKLNLDRNRLFSVSGNGAGLPSLQELRLQRNNLDEEALLSSGLLHHLPSLTSLNLHGNQLRHLPSLMFQNCTALRQLKLSKNKLSTLSDGVFYGLSNLKELVLDQNNLTTVSKQWLFGLSGLEVLSLRHNAITTLAPRSWHDITTNLLSLDLSYNKLVSLHGSFLKGLTRLEYLQVSHNQLSTVMPETFKNTPNLLQLDLSFNNLRWTVEDGGDYYVGLDKLQSLDLSHNNIEAVQFQSLAPLTGLLKLDLRGNDIRTLHDNPFRNLLSTPGESSVLLLNTSSMVCDCHLSWLSEWLESTSIDLSGVHATCKYPPSEAGVAIHNIAKLDLPCDHSPRPFILGSPEERIVLLEADVELKCVALVGSRGGEPNIIWRRDNQPVVPYKLDKIMNVEKADPGGGVIMRMESVLHLTRVTHQDAGHYQCVVRNDHGVGYSKLAFIEVQVKPYFTVLPSSIHTEVSGVARLECAAEGQPPPEISLQKDGSDDFPAARERRLLVDSKETVFFIKPVTAADEGTYTCSANSTAGSARASANITVWQAPFFLHPVREASFRPGDIAVLHCQGAGWPYPLVTWLREGVVVGSGRMVSRFASVDDGEFLIVLDVRPEDAGRYTCQLTNTYGKRDQTVMLSVSDGIVVDGNTTLVLVMLAVVVCVVVTSIVWVIIIYHTRKRPRSSAHHHPALGFPLSSPSSSPRHCSLFSPGGGDSPSPPDALLGHTDLDEDAGVGHTTDIVLVGPDTGSEHSAGKDSGVGDSSQRSSEDLRQLNGGVPNGGITNGQVSTFCGELGTQSPARSSLMVYAEQNPQLPAILRGGSSLSVATDSDVRFEDGRPRLSTFGGGSGSATLRRPSGHRPIPVPVPCVLPGRHMTATLPHKHSLRARLVERRPSQRDCSRETVSTDGGVTSMQGCQGDDSLEDFSADASSCYGNAKPTNIVANPLYNNQSSAYSPNKSHYKDPNPYSKPNNRLLSSRLLNSEASNSNNTPSELPSPQYMSANKCIPKSDPAVDDGRSQVSSPQYMHASVPAFAPEPCEPIYGRRSDRLESPQYMTATLKDAGKASSPLRPGSRYGEDDIYRRMSGSHGRPSDYSAPTIVYSESSGVQIGGLGAPPPPPPPPPNKPVPPADPIYGRTSVPSFSNSSAPYFDSREPSAPR